MLGTLWSIPPSKYPAKTVLVCLPEKSIYHEFDKYPVTTIHYMPVWSDNEVSSCRAKIFPHHDPTLVEELFRKWGGIPRFVLEKADDYPQQKNLDDEISKCDTSLFNYVGDTNNYDGVIHIHTNSPDEENLDVSKHYQKKVLQFASQYVSEKVMTKIKSHFKEDLCKFLMADMPRLGTIRGALFEEVAHQILIHGGRFKYRHLDSITTSDIKHILLDKQNCIEFQEISQIEDDKYCRPLQKNFTSVDAIIAPTMLFQMTYCPNHPIKISGLKSLQEKLGGPNAQHEIMFFFVLPKQLYLSFQKQQFLTLKNTANEQKPAWITRCIKQYALEIDLDSVTEIRQV
ncbi:6323_t:CDS:1 [Paraglomus brasilianum]|uniref:6323_t:CDS:1 n=1 Tax=Paraglomus brasilianum TaxID=144538 RepID=A0A9N9CI94_9GLOM|nr:6323_t:CDS:1 [Paraglomus brasilianum]